MTESNVLGGPLEPCGTDPVTGFYRDGCCSCGPEDVGLHAVCAVMTPEFLEHQISIGNDQSRFIRNSIDEVKTHECERPVLRMR